MGFSAVVFLRFRRWGLFSITSMTSCACLASLLCLACPMPATACARFCCSIECRGYHVESKHKQSFGTATMRVYIVSWYRDCKISCRCSKSMAACAPDRRVMLLVCAVQAYDTEYSRYRVTSAAPPTALARTYTEYPARGKNRFSTPEHVALH